MFQQEELPIRDADNITPVAAFKPPESPHLSPSVGVGYPLTKSNLRRLEKSTATSEMGGKGSGRKPDSSKTPQTGTLSQPAASNDGSSRAAKADTKLIRTTLEEHNFLIEHRPTRRNHSKVIEEAKKVIDGKRGSAMGDDEQELLVNTLADEVLTNEDTFIDLLWWNLFNGGNSGTRMVPKVEMRREDLEDDDWMSRAWRHDFLLHNRNRLFRSNCLPPLKIVNEAMRKLIESLPNLSVPKPDLLYGITKEGFTKEENRINNTYPMFTELSPDRYHAFFLVEFKSHKGDLEDAINQASRSAGALIHGLRCLDDLTPRKNIKKGIDTRTWLFTLAVDTHYARLFVNWAYIEDDGTPVYHMHKLAGYELDEGSRLAELKRHIGNVMDWGVGERKEMIKKMLKGVSEDEDELSGL